VHRVRRVNTSDSTLAEGSSAIEHEKLLRYEYDTTKAGPVPTNGPPKLI
jgi:hypothetical protein